MNFKLFLKEKAITILLLLFGIITIEIFLMAYNVGLFIKIYIPHISYIQKRQYPYVQKNTQGINKNVKDNNIKYNST